ncbi:mandelate racemase/muconate lactonizing enzyme family protein [Leisingera sp. McT4-56]|uniref:mandelate racemase/muconate lactonizing enzyme family protein n=1 Tax=Leisingera sp. McT4-56 TaxID=2881255 RepID=UPI001CF8D778|nr:mandelate racemase/muconate lactonizing enzyme family protein [Leisingera sp. McT4-56]MCB4457306.1 mandelate racemase/muconate lactonizing enzyme family protein [Leisingera sp. McT4-56]
MKITKLTVYCVVLDKWGVETRYTKTLNMEIPLETTVLRIDTDEGLTGWGETMTAPSYYLPTSPQSARAGIELIAPALLGQDPLNHRARMEDIRFAMRGHKPTKSVIDMALWDLQGKARGLPLVHLWGGRVVEDMPVLCLVNTASPEEQVAQIEEFRAQGYKLFQIKIGHGSPQLEVARIRACQQAMREDERCWFDVNRAWTVDQAMQVMPLVRDLAPLIEQPCETYEQCRTVARHTGMGLMLDEAIEDQDSFIRAAEDGVINVAVLKMGCTGGISEHRHLVETGLRLDIPMRIEDFYGTGLTLAAVSHLAQGLPAAATFGLYDYHLPAVPVVKNPFPVVNGRVKVPEDCAPGLGVEVDPEVLGDPVAEYRL